MKISIAVLILLMLLGCENLKGYGGKLLLWEQENCKQYLGTKATQIKCQF